VSVLGDTHVGEGEPLLGVAVGNGFGEGAGSDALVVLAFILAALGLGAATLRRRTA